MRPPLAEMGEHLPREAPSSHSAVLTQCCPAQCCPTQSHVRPAGASVSAWASVLPGHPAVTDHATGGAGVDLVRRPPLAERDQPRADEFQAIEEPGHLPPGPPRGPGGRAPPVTPR